MQGRDSAKAWLRENDSIREEITLKVKEILGLIPIVESTNGVAKEVAEA